MGPFDRFNDRAKRVLALAQDEAIRFNHNYLGTEHVLLGLIREGEGVAARGLDSLGVDLSQLRGAVESMIGRGADTTSPSEITLAPHTKQVIGSAIEESRKLGHSVVGTEHLLLGIVIQAECTGAKILASLIDLEKVRQHVIATLGGKSPPHSAPQTSAPHAGGSRGPFDRFNDRAKRVLALSQDEAIRFNHNYIGPEHLVLGLAREGEGIAARALEALGIDMSKLRSSVEKIVGRGDSATSPSEITLSPRTKRIIELAIAEAGKLGHNSVGTEHLLLGLVRDTGSIAAIAIESAGVSLESVRAKVIELLGLLGQPTSDAPPPPSLHSLTTFAGFGGTFDRLNDRARRVLTYAQEEAIRFKHNYIGTEHLLLGLVRDGESVAARTLNSLGVELSKVRTAVEFIIGAGDVANMPSSPDGLTISPRTKKVIELAIDEARRLGHSRAGPEHLLLGLVREGEGIASGVIESLGVTLAKVRQQLIATLGQMGPGIPTNAYANTLIPFDLLDDAAKRVLSLAEEEARQMRHGWIGTEHMLIALARSDGVAQRTLKELGVTLELARAGVFKAVPPAETDVTEITVTPRVKTLVGKAIMLAAPQSDRVRPQHLLLALVTDPDGIGAQVLTELGATHEKVRKTVDKLTQG